jgi:hypothetical protein
MLLLQPERLHLQLHKQQQLLLLLLLLSVQLMESGRLGLLAHLPHSVLMCWHSN